MTTEQLFDAKPPKVTVTTRDVNLFMQRTYSEAGGYACLFEVANGTGSSAKRSADIVLMNLWPSRGMDLIGYEVKTSRSDWLRELKDPAKAWPVMQYMDRWFLLAAPGVAKPEEIPSNWGFQEFDGKRVRTVKAAPMLEAKPISRSFLGALVRRQVRDAEAAVSLAVAAQNREFEQRVDAEASLRADRMQRDSGRLREKLDALKEKTGIDLLGFEPNETVAHALKFAMRVDPMSKWAGLGGAIQQVESALKNLQSLRTAIDGGSE